MNDHEQFKKLKNILHNDIIKVPHPNLIYITPPAHTLLYM